jgi:hypothetical protein
LGKNEQKRLGRQNKQLNITNIGLLIFSRKAVKEKVPIRRRQRFENLTTLGAKNEISRLIALIPLE